MNFAGRRLAVLGAGVEGRATVNYLLAHGADDLTVHDRQSELSEPLPAGVKTVLGELYLNNLTGYSAIFRSPGIPYHTSEIQAAKTAGVTITSHTKLFFENCLAPIVGITGTKGKGTTAGLVYGMLQKSDRKGWLGGNIGQPPLEFLDEINPDDVVVLELSSFQLQDLQQGPRVAVLTNVTVDHLDHHQSVEEYHEAKANLLKYQSSNDLAVINADDFGSQDLKQYARGRVVQFSHQRTDQQAVVMDGMVLLLADESVDVLPVSDIPVPGPHNLDNILAACLVAQELGVTSEQMAEAIRDYRGLPFHLEYIGKHKGAQYFNDSYAVNPTATIPALDSFAGHPIVWIVGGYERNLDFTTLAEVALSHDLRAILWMQEAGERLISTLQEQGNADDRELPPVIQIKSPETIVQQATEVAQSGDIVLFSPGAPSFGWFKNYTERGEAFTRQFQALPS